MFGGGWEEVVGKLIWNACWWFRFFLPSYYSNKTKAVFSEIFERLGYDENILMASLKSQKMFIISILCVDKNARNEGIGSNLVTKALQNAANRNCDSSTVIVSNKFSKRLVKCKTLKLSKPIVTD